MHDVQVEVFLLSLTAGTELRWRVVTGELATRSHPDVRVRELAGVVGDPTRTVVHSTSWRQGPEGLILTYVVLPDPDPLAGATRAVPAECRIATCGLARYLGERRLRMLESTLEPDVVVLGVDEHTACVFDLDADLVTVLGRGAVTARRNGTNTVFAAGRTIPTQQLRTAASGGGVSGTDSPQPMWSPHATSHPTPVAERGSPAVGSRFRHQPVPAGRADRGRRGTRPGTGDRPLVGGHRGVGQGRPASGHPAADGDAPG